MKALRFLTIIFLPIAQTAILMVGLAFPPFYFYCVLGGFVVTDALLALFFKKHISRSLIVWLATPIILLFGASAAALIVVEEPYIIKSILAAQCIFQFLYLLNLYYYLYRSDKYQEHSFWQITAAVHVLSFFNGVLALYGLIYYVDYSIVYLIIPFGLITAIAYAQQLVIHQLSPRQYWRFWGIQTLLVLEFALIIHLLPSSYITKAFFLTIPFFLTSQFGYTSLKKELNVKSLISTVLLSLVVLLLVLVTTRWR